MIRPLLPIRRLLRNLVRRDDGSLPLAMMLTLVGTTLSTLTVPVLINQLQDTAETMDRAQALHAAEAGLDAVMGGIRATVGDLGLLINVCGSPWAGTLTGTVSYNATMTLQTATSTAIGCNLTAMQASPPALAFISSTGSAGRTKRKLTATYVLRFTNENIEGGLVRFYGGAYCLDGGSGSPAVGTNVTTQPCTTGAIRQTFAYTKQLQLQLVSSRTATNPLGMCLDSGIAPGTGVLVNFQVCGSPTIPFNQRWNINDSSNFQSTNLANTGLGSYCFHAKAGATPGAFVELNTCAGAADNTRTFAPEASVGAGAAGPPYQMVNFKQFGRCIDVTNFNVTLGYLIVWPCKQAPNPLNVGWNQRFNIPTTGDGLGAATGSITTYDSSKLKTYCLVTADPAPATAHFVTAQDCTTANATKSTWKVSYQEKTYVDSYVIKDSAGNCLTPANLDDPKLPSTDIFKGSTTVSKLTVARCDGSKLQKWNAPANIEDPTPLKDIGETTP
jgi:hypothetical protein